jgi:peptide/nickel transport system permease protein
MKKWRKIMGLGTYVIRRLLLLIPILLGVSVIIFAITEFFDPYARAALYVNPVHIKPQDWPAVFQRYGLLDPIYVRYYRWITEVFHGNLGYSQENRMFVIDVIKTKLPASAEIAIYTTPLTILLGIWLGVKSAVHRDKVADHVTRIIAIIGWSLPTFWSAIILLSIFYGGFGIFPPGRLGSAAEDFISLGVRSGAYTVYTGLNTIDGLLNGQPWISWDALQHLILPCINLTIVQIALLIRVMRSSMLEELNKGYITTARAKGLSQGEIINKHARRNALIPVVTLAGLLVAGMMTGVVITETVFHIDGLGASAARAALHLDIPFVLGFAMFTAIVFVVANLIVDVLYAYIDPRIRLG